MEIIERLEAALSRCTVQKEYFSIQEVAIKLGLSESYVRRAIRTGAMVSSDIGTPRRPIYRVAQVDIDAFMRRRKEGAAPKLQRPQSRHYS